jgi:hypothetical protein
MREGALRSLLFAQVGGLLGALGLLNCMGSLSRSDLFIFFSIFP